MRRMWDAAFPPANPPRWEAVAGYIGGNTPHVWTAAEWARQPARFRLPIFVRSHDGDPKADAAFSVRWLKGHGVPKGVTLALDYETRVDAAYLKAFDRTVVAAGWKVMVYGSRRTVLQNPKPSGGYWDAQWTNVPHLNPGSAATQYGGDVTLGRPYDASLVADSTPLWDTQKKEDISMADAQDILDALGKLRRDLTVHGTTGLAETTEKLYGNAKAAAITATEIKTLVEQAQDPATLATLLAGQLTITGISTEPGGVVTVTFGPKPA